MKVFLCPRFIETIHSCNRQIYEGLKIIQLPPKWNRRSEFSTFFRFLSPPLQRTCSKLGWCDVKRDFNRTKSEEKLNIVYHGPWQEIFLAPCDGCGWRKLCTRKPEKLSFRTSYKLLMRNNETPKGSEFSLRFMYLTKYRIKIIVLRLSISLILSFQIHSRVSVFTFVYYYINKCD